MILVAATEIGRKVFLNCTQEEAQSRWRTLD